MEDKRTSAAQGWKGTSLQKVCPGLQCFSSRSKRFSVLSLISFSGKNKVPSFQKHIFMMTSSVINQDISEMMLRPVLARESCTGL